MAEGCLATEGGQHADGGDDVPDPPVAGFGPGPEPLEEEGADGDQGQNADVAGHLLEVVRADVGSGPALVAPQHERGGDRASPAGRAASR